MHISFTAIKSNFEADEYALVASLEGIDSNIVLQRDSEQNFEDWGIYVEFSGQQNGDYEYAESCFLSRESLRVKFSRQLGDLAEIIDFDIKLEIDEKSYAQLLNGLPRIFRGISNSLQID